MANPFEFDELIEEFDKILEELPDHRTGKNIQYQIKDAAKGAFGVFFTQSPSFLAYQRDLQRRKGRDNAQTLFQVEQIPSDAQIRNLLDPLEPEYLSGLFLTIFNKFSNSKRRSEFQVSDERWLISLDGTQHFSSTRIHCDTCHQSQQQDGTLRYSHHLLSPVVVHPDHNQVLSLPPEFMQPQPDHDRQDCEREAAKRWIKQYGAQLKGQPTTLLGDDLYANQPMCHLALNHHFDFIFVCKPGSHTHLYDWLAGLDKLDAGLATVTDRHWNGRFHEIWTYRYENQVPLRAGDDPLLVNWLQLTITRADTNDQLYRTAFVTNQPVTDETVADLAQAGRARWKVENEHNNVLKTKGYHLEHNFGHGQQHLANFLLTLNLLAFLFHTLFDLFDDQYRLIRQELGRRQTFFNDIRALTRYFIFDSWQALLDFMFERLEITIPPPTSAHPI